MIGLETLALTLLLRLTLLMVFSMVLTRLIPLLRLKIMSSQ